MNSLGMAFIKETYNWLYEKVKQDNSNNQVLEPFYNKS